VKRFSRSEVIDHDYDETIYPIMAEHTFQWYGIKMQLLFFAGEIKFIARVR